MKPCQKCGAPINNAESYCIACEPTVAGDRDVVPSQDVYTVSSNVDAGGMDPFVLKLSIFLFGLLGRFAIWVTGVPIACFIFGVSIPLRQSILIGCVIAGVITAVEMLDHWLHSLMENQSR
jgi:hypothetical protein